jgi:hypothetical protein
MHTGPVASADEEALSDAEGRLGEEDVAVDVSEGERGHGRASKGARKRLSQ